MTQKESTRKVQVWTHDEILSSHQNYQVTQVTMNMANHFVCSRLASKDYFHSRMSRYPNSVSTFHLIRLFVILEQVPLLKTAIVSLALVVFILLRLVHIAVLWIIIYSIPLRFGCAWARLHLSNRSEFGQQVNLHNSVVTLAKSKKSLKSLRRRKLKSTRCFYISMLSNILI